MKRLVILFILSCMFAPPVYAANDDGSASCSSKQVVVTDRCSTSRGSLTTIFQANNGYAGNTFDIEPIYTIPEITAMDINWMSAGEILEVDTYYKIGTADGFETSPDDWTTLAPTVTGVVGAGPNMPTFVDLSGNGVVFPANGYAYGIAVCVSNFASLSGHLGYTNGQYTYSNADLSLTTWHGEADPIFSTAFFPRAWNGTLYYGTGPLQALYVFPYEISAFYGGSFTFMLFGKGYGHRDYILLGSAAGMTPPMTLPGGATVNLAKDWFTTLILKATLAGGWGVLNDFIGTLDADGFAYATLTLPGYCPLYEDLDLWFAWTTLYPFDYQSNTVMVLVTGADAQGQRSISW